MKKTIYIDPQGGISGDIFSSALISAGVPAEKMIAVLMQAAQKIGNADISVRIVEDESTQLDIQLTANEKSIKGHAAYHILNELFEECKIEPVYCEFGNSVLNILLKAEQEAHSKFVFLTDKPTHHHHHDHDHNHNHNHSHDHNHNHEHAHHQHHHSVDNLDAHLHEAQDIIIDILGAVFGLQYLDIEPKAFIVNEISAGGGKIIFSHGELNVPAPATQIIFDNYKIPWVKGPIDKELCTPTGAAIMAALNPQKAILPANMQIAGQSRGGKILPIEPFKIYFE